MVTAFGSESAHRTEVEAAQVEQAMALGVIGQIHNPTIRLLAQISYYTLQPVRRVLWLQHQDIGSQAILFPGEPGSGMQLPGQRMIAIPDELAVVLQQQPLAPEDGVWLFPACARRGNATTQRWAQAKDALGNRHSFSVEQVVRPVITYGAVAHSLKKAVERLDSDVLPCKTFSSKSFRKIRARYLYFCQNMTLSEVMNLTGHRSTPSVRAFLGGKSKRP